MLLKRISSCWFALGVLVVMALAAPRASAVGFVTSERPMINGSNGFATQPIFTVGEVINGYRPPGILDGLGAVELNASTVRVYANHETGNSVGYYNTLANGTQIRGSRISYFDIEKSSKTITGAGLAYDTIIGRSGSAVSSVTPINGLTRLCSGGFHLAGANTGFVDNMYLAGEETLNGTAYALDPATNVLHAVPALGKFAWENLTPLKVNDPTKVAVVIADDSDTEPMYIYVGDKNGVGDGSFLDRNGLKQGKIYAWVSDTGEKADSQFKGAFGTNLQGTFKEVEHFNLAKANTPGFDAQGYADWNTISTNAAAVNAFEFSRPEDVHVNPLNPSQLVLAATGNVIGVDQDNGGSSTNKYGAIYQFDFDVTNLAGITAGVTILHDSDHARDTTGMTPLRSADNLVWADNGMILIQEDRSVTATEFGQFNPLEAGILLLDPTTGNLLRVATIDQTAIPAGQGVINTLGNWESSGIIDVSSLFGYPAGTLFLGDVQAHALTSGSIGGSTNLVQGGQLFFLAVIPEPATVSLLGLAGLLIGRRRSRA